MSSHRLDCLVAARSPPGIIGAALIKNYKSMRRKAEGGGFEPHTIFQVPSAFEAVAVSQAPLRPLYRGVHYISLLRKKFQPSPKIQKASRQESS